MARGKYIHGVKTNSDVKTHAAGEHSKKKSGAQSAVYMEEESRTASNKDPFFDLFVEQLSDIFDAENQIVEALPKLVREASSSELKEAFQNHLEETRQQVIRLKKIFKLIKERPQSVTCRACEGLIEEGDEVLNRTMPPLVKDAALIATAQRVEHYEIAVYGTLIAFAKQFSLNEVEDLLQETLKEEANADKTLSGIAEGGFFKTGINQQAREQS